MGLATVIVAAQVVTAEDRIAAVLENATKMYEIATVIERYEIVHDGLPRAKNAAELSTVIDSESILANLKDPWGTAYAIDSDPDRGSYRIVGAGSDRRFDPMSWKREERFSDPAADTVLINVQFTRSNHEWALDAYKKVTFDATTRLEQGLVSRTRVDVMSLAVAISEYRLKTGRYPIGASSDDLIRQLEKYSKHVPRTDAWGTPFAITASQDGSFRIVSAGSDKKFENDSPLSAETTEDYTRDLIYTEKGWLREWRKKPLGRLAAAYSMFTFNKGQYESLKSMSDDDKRKLRNEALLEAADESYNKGNTLAALKRYRDVERSDPAFADIGRLMRYATEFADISVSDVPSPPPRATPAWLGGVYLMSESEQAEAAQLAASSLRKAITSHPDEWPLFEMLADLEARRGHIPDADAVLQRFEAAHPRDVRVASARLKIDEFLKHTVR